MQAKKILLLFPTNLPIVVFTIYGFSRERVTFFLLLYFMYAADIQNEALWFSEVV